LLPEPLPVLEEPLPVLLEPPPVLLDPVPVLVDPAPVLELPAPVLVEPVPVDEEPAPLLEEPLPVLDEPEESLVPGMPLPSTRVTWQFTPAPSLMESVRVPASMTTACTDPTAKLALEPSTLASMELPSLERETEIMLDCPVYPAQVRTPSRSVGVEESMTRASRASRPRKWLVALTKRRARGPLRRREADLLLKKKLPGMRERNPPVRLSRPIGSPIQKKKPVLSSGTNSIQPEPSPEYLRIQIEQCGNDGKAKKSEKSIFFRAVCTGT
jgi:hypothetical protein